MISEALNFKVFQGKQPLDPLHKLSPLVLFKLLPHAATNAAPSKENMLCGQIQNHGWFCEQCFIRTLNQGGQKKDVGTISKLDKKISIS